MTTLFQVRIGFNHDDVSERTIESKPGSSLSIEGVDVVSNTGRLVSSIGGKLDENESEQAERTYMYVKHRGRVCVGHGGRTQYRRRRKQNFGTPSNYLKGHWRRLHGQTTRLAER